MPLALPSRSELAMLARLTRDLPGYLRSPITPEQAARTLMRRLETRAERFLGLVERLIYRHPSSPYRRLLVSAGCELGDLLALVGREGLDGALNVLAERGIYVAFADSYALLQRERPIGDFGLSVEAFYFTSLEDHQPKVMLNVEVGDYGVVERREYGCYLEALGLGLHLSEIRSHEKLSGEGMTFARTRLIGVLEDVLPARFGGSNLDYRLLEAEDRDGILRLYLLASPELGPLDEAELRATFLAELAQGGEVDGYMARVWEWAGTVRVKREKPVATRAGKIFPFHLVKEGR